MVRGWRSPGLAVAGQESYAAASQFLVDQGLAEMRGLRVLPSRNLLTTLLSRELGKGRERHCY